MPTVTTFDALLSGATWNGDGVTNRPTFLTYSFDASAPAYYTGIYPPVFLASFQAFTAAEQATARTALKAWADVSGLALFEVPAGQGDIRFGVYDFRLGPEDIEDSAGFAFNPAVYNYEDGGFEFAYGGDIFIDLGQTTFDVLAHEIGHALGLKHPFEGNIRLDTTIDDAAHTVMTYNAVLGEPTQLGTLDVLAIQYLYGGPTSDGTHDASWSWDPVRLLLTQTDGPGADMIAGVAVADSIASGGGNDYVVGRAGRDQIDGQDGDDTLAGGEDADTISGGAGIDVIDGDEGDDLVEGGDGNDEIFGIDGADTLNGGLGDDMLDGGSGRNRLNGGAGSDVIVVVDGTSTVDGGEGFDQLWLSPFSSASANLSYASLTAGGGSYVSIESFVIFGDVNADTLTGGAFPDLLLGDSGADSLTGAADDDFLFGDAGADFLSAGDGDDELYGDTGADTLVGGDGDDFLAGSSGDDMIAPGLGADEIFGGIGIDTVDFTGELIGIDVVINAQRFLGGGVIERMSEVENLIGSAFGDNILGDAGPNRLFGAGGSDVIAGGEGTNYLRGDEGDDTITGGSGFDDINGNMGNDSCVSGGGDDWVVGGRDNDTLMGSAGQNLVYGNLGADSCDGGAGNDIIRGGQENDVCSGGAGDDFVSGDKGDDTMTGGSGADSFHTFGDAGLDRVLDFNRGEGDRVQLDPGTVYTVAQVGADTVISMTGGGQMILVGVSMTSLTGAWIFGN